MKFAVTAADEVSGVSQTTPLNQIRADFKRAQRINQAFLQQGYTFQIDGSLPDTIDGTCAFLVVLDSNKIIHLRFGAIVSKEGELLGHKAIAVAENEQRLGGGTVGNFVRAKKYKRNVPEKEEIKNRDLYSYEGKDLRKIVLAQCSSTYGGFSNNIVFGFISEFRKQGVVASLVDTLADKQKQIQGFDRTGELGLKIQGVDLEEIVLVANLTTSREFIPISLNDHRSPWLAPARESLGRQSVGFPRKESTRRAFTLPRAKRITF